jgi:hypothetical protein
MVRQFFVQSLVASITCHSNLLGNPLSGARLSKVFEIVHSPRRRGADIAYLALLVHGDLCFAGVALFLT